MNSANRRIWLVKLPEYLAERINDIDEDGIDLGSVKAVSGNNSVKLLLNPNGPCGDLPLEYSLQLSNCGQIMHLFCEDYAGRAVMMEGKVERECQLKPILNDQYREVMRQRNELANKPKRTIQMMDSINETPVMGMVPHVKENEILARRKKRYESDSRKERLPKEEVTDMLFRAFERISHWNFKALVDHTQQPSGYLKDILSEIAIYNTRGPYKSLYELKPEYKKM